MRWFVYLIFAGEVQGVGFRKEAKEIADSLGLTGWVRNLPDQKVELYACGTTTEQIDTLLEKLEEAFFIEEWWADYEKDLGTYSDFSIRV